MGNPTAGVGSAAPVVRCLVEPHQDGADEPGLRQAGGYAAFGRGAKGRGRAEARGADDGEAVASPKRAKLGAPRSAT